MIDESTCPVCLAGTSTHYVDVEGLPYLRCDACRSIHVCVESLREIDAGRSQMRDYGENYWAMELKAARYRAKGEALSRAGEAILYCRRPVHRFLDVGAGPGFLLEKLLESLDPDAEIFHAVEKFPAPAGRLGIPPHPARLQGIHRQRKPQIRLDPDA